MNLVSLLESYGWQVAIVGLIGMIVVGILKKPFKLVVNKIAKKEISDTGFDTAAFLLGFVVAIILGVVYSIVALHCGWLYSYVDGVRVLETYTWVHWITTILGTWGFQVAYYNIWKKLGLKRILLIIWRGIVAVFKRMLDKNKDGSVTVDEAVSTVTDLLHSGKLNIDQVLSSVAAAAPQVAADVISAVTEEAGEEGKVNLAQDVAKLEEVTQTIVSTIPQEKLGTVVSNLVEEAGKKVQQAVENTPEVADSASVQPPKKPVIKF